MVVPTKDLPPFVQSTLKRLGYHARDIKIEMAETVSPIDYGGRGQQGKLVIIDMRNWSVFKELHGSWGGANMFNPNNAVDLDDNEYPIPVNAMVIKGSFGYHKFARIILNPVNAQKFLPPAEINELTDTEKSILGVYRGIKSSYRKEYLKNIKGFSQELIKGLADKGFLKINKAGAVSVTTKGKNVDVPRMY